MPSTQTGKETAVSAAVEALRKAMVAGDKMKLSILTVWLQREGEWKLLARQAAKL